MEAKRTRRVLALGDAFLLTPEPNRVLSVLNGNGHREWAASQHGVWIARFRQAHGRMPTDKEQVETRSQYEEQAERLKEDLTKLAIEWLLSGKRWNDATTVRKLVEQFLNQRRPHVAPIFDFARDEMPVLYFPGQSKDDPKADAAHHLRLLLLYICASDWSRHLYRCTCGKFFVRPRTSAEEPKCSREHNETPKKRDQRNKQRVKRLRAAREAIKSLSQRHSSEWPVDLRAWVAKEAAKSLPPNLAFDKTFVTRNFDAQLMVVEDRRRKEGNHGTR